MRLLLCAMLFSLLAANVRAQGLSDDERAATHFRVAQEFFEREAFEEALVEFQRAFALSDRPQLLFNIGLSHDRLGQWAEARDNYERFLERAPNDVQAEHATRRLARARQRAARAQPGGETDTTPEESISNAEPEERVSEPDASSGALGWALLGTGAAAGITSLVTGLVANSIHQDLEASCGESRTCSPDQQSDIDRGQRLARTSTAMMFIGIAGVTAGVIALVLHRPIQDDPVQATISPVQGGAFVSTSVSF